MHYGFCVNLSLSSPDNRLDELEKCIISNNYDVKITPSDL